MLLSVQSESSAIHTQGGGLGKIHLGAGSHAQVTAFDHRQRLVHQICRVATQLGQHHQRIHHPLDGDIMLCHAHHALRQQKQEQKTSYGPERLHGLEIISESQTEIHGTHL